MSKHLKSIKDWWGGWLALFTFILGLSGQVLIDHHQLPVERATQQSLVLLDSQDDWLHVRVQDGIYRVEPRGRVSETYQRLLIAYEDRRFYSHFGLDLRAIARATLENIRHGSVTSGASTLSMQVSRLLRPHARSFSGKVNQALGAIWLESRFSKREILDLYFLIAPFGRNLEGVEMASRYWFGKPSSRLSLSEAALLVAIPQNPSKHSPVLNPKGAIKARNRVLLKGYEAGIVSEAEYLDATLSPLPETPQKFPQLNHHLADQLQVSGSQGYVKTTISRNIQVSLNRLGKTWRLGENENVGALIVERTGEVIGQLGSSDYFDRDRNGSIDFTRRQRSPGSTLKPIVYGLAEDAGVLRYEDIFEDIPRRFGDYAPRNFDNTNNGQSTFGTSLIRSDNRAAVEALRKLGPLRFAATLKNVDIDLVGPIGLPNVVGGIGIRLADVCKLYLSFLNDGVVIELQSQRGGVPSTGVLLSREAARRTNYLLRQAGLPAGRQNSVGLKPFALKTGTGPRGSDTLAIWYDAEHVVCTWIGTPSNEPKARNTGLRTAAPFALAVSDLLPNKKAPQALPIGPPRKQKTNFGNRLDIVFPEDMSDLFFPSDEMAIRPLIPGAIYPVEVTVNGRFIEILESPRDVLKIPSSGFWKLQFLDKSLSEASLSIRTRSGRARQ